jgi:DinB superfamily
MKESSLQLAAIVDQSARRLRQLSEQDSAKPLRAGGWSAKQVIGHLIDSASNNHQRFVRAALQGELEWPGYDQEGCVRVEAFQQAPWKVLIDAWSGMNLLLAHVLAHMPEHAATFRCRISDEAEMPLAGLAASYVEHMRHHLAQIGAL